MNEGMSEEETFKIFSPQMWLDAIWTYLPSLLYEAQIEGTERQEQAEDFVMRYPHGIDCYGLPELPQHKRLTHFIPTWLGDIHE